MTLIYLDYYLFQKNFPKEAKKLERTSEQFERKRKLDLRRQLDNIMNEEEYHDTQANRFYEAEAEDTRP